VSNYMALRKLNLQIMQGEFVCIIGDVGSGKSSLLSTLIGDMLHLDPALLESLGDQDLADLKVKQ
jgi:ABC-type lipoprotein export system ATPase subunit